jgi:hypothetical protein
MKFDSLANLQTQPERHRPQSRVNADLPEVGTCVGRRRLRLSTGRYHPPILARLRQAAGIRKKSSSTLQCKLLEYCAWKQCASKSRSFFGALSVNMVQVCCSLVFQWVKRGQSVRGSHRLQQPGGWNRSVGNWRECAWYVIATGSIDLQKTASKEVSEYSGCFYRSRSRSLQLCQTYCVHNPK